jgi:hypothetical protein
MRLCPPGTNSNRTFLSFCAAILLAACGSSAPDNGGAAGSGGTSSPDPNAFEQKFKLSDNEIAGWKQDTGPGALAVFTADHLTDAIDGAAPDYTSRGCRVAMYQNLIGPGEETCRLVAMDFGTDANATSMVQFERNLTSASIQVPPYDASVAIASEVLSGITAYAHFKSSYFEVQLTGFSDLSSAVQAAASFLGVLQAKAN